MHKSQNRHIKSNRSTLQNPTSDKILSGSPKHGSEVRSKYRVAVVEWISEEDGLADVICDELEELGHCPESYKYNSSIPQEVDVIFTFGPYGNYLPVVSRLASEQVKDRTVFVHWNTEGMPDLRLPWSLVTAVGAGRSWIGRLGFSHNGVVGNLAKKLTSPWENRVLRFRYIGDYRYAHRQGWLHILADSSAIYTGIHNQHGLPAIAVPWGATKRWYSDLNLERDIDVLWIGQRGSNRRSRLLDLICRELQASGVKVHIFDNERKPFIYGQERTEILNRAKITLNLTRTWFDDNFSRFAMAAPNRSMIVSEPLLPHCPQYEVGVHYASAPAEQLADTIRYYLDHDDEREQIVKNDYKLSTEELTFTNSIGTVIEAVTEFRRIQFAE